MRVLDLFSGIGGFSLGLERAGMETVAFCESHPHRQKVLRKNWPDTPILENVESLRGYEVSSDLICGGFPCQAFSHAARGRNTAADMWPEMFRIIMESSVKYVIAENVQRAPIERAQRELDRAGFSTICRDISAAFCGAPHERRRWWLIAHTNDQSKLQRAIDAEVAKLPELCSGLWTAKAYAGTIRIPNGVPSRLDPNRVNRLEALGNAVVPQIPEAIGRAILSIDAQYEPHQDPPRTEMRGSE